MGDGCFPSFVLSFITFSCADWESNPGMELASGHSPMEGSGATVTPSAHIIFTQSAEKKQAGRPGDFIFLKPTNLLL